jgi:hypothetical protein
MRRMFLVSIRRNVLRLLTPYNAEPGVGRVLE